MLKPLSITLLSALVTALLWAGVPAESAAQPAEIREAQERQPQEPPMIRREGTGLRLGLLVQGLVDAPNTGPIFYFDLGLKHKVGEYYLEVRAPVLFMLIDGMITLVRFLFQPNAMPFFFMMNGDDLPGHWELGHARLGYRFRLIPPGNTGLLQNSYTAAVGFLATADMVAFEARRDLSASQARAAGYPEPFVIGGGGFFKVGREQELVSYDLSVGGGLGRSMFEQVGAGPVYFFTADADIRYELEIRGSVYIRPRITTYVTEMDPAVHVTGSLTTGLDLRF